MQQLNRGIQWTELEKRRMLSNQLSWTFNKRKDGNAVAVEETSFSGLRSNACGVLGSWLSALGVSGYRCFARKDKILAEAIT
jgi:hypothetical protein